MAPVLVRVGWESGDRYRQLPINLCSLGKMLLRGTLNKLPLLHGDALTLSNI